MSYTPQPGTLAARALPVLARLAEGQWLSSSELADRLDTESILIGSSLKYAEACGAVRSEKRGRLLYWQAGDECPPAPPEASGPGGLLGWKAPAMPVFVHAGPVVSADLDEIHPREDAKAATASQPPEEASPATPKDGGLAQGRGSHQPSDSEAQAFYATLLAQKGGDLLGFTAPATARFALWSNGVLEIRRDTVGGAAPLVLLAPDETRALLHYLDRIAVREGTC